MKQLFLSLYNSFLHIFSKDKKPFVYVSLGDSSVEGMGASKQERTYPGIIFHAIKDTYENASWHNLGKHESTTNDVIIGQLDKAIEHQPDLITLSIGVNDIRFRTSLRTFEKNLRTLLTTLKKTTKAEIVMNNIPDISLTPRVPNKLRAYVRWQVWRFNRVIEKLAKQFDIILVDVCSQTRLYARNYPEMIAPDGFHPTDFGYAIWANTILAHIQHIVGRKSILKSLSL